MSVSLPGTTETCGRCGVAVEAGSDVCPACGALLAAYRNPLSAPNPPSPEPRRIATRPAADRTVHAEAPVSEPFVESVRPSDDPVELDRARARLLATLIEPQQRLLEVVQPDSAPPRAVAVATPVRAVVPRPATRKPHPPAPLAPQKPATPERPRKPGFVIRGAVEPVLAFGVVLGIAGLASTFLGAAIESTAIEVAGIVGVVVAVALVVFGIGIALVRRDQERG